MQMSDPLLYQRLADLVLVLHVGIVLFVIGGWLSSLSATCAAGPGRTRHGSGLHTWPPLPSSWLKPGWVPLAR
jgi:hypothetical protein